MHNLLTRKVSEALNKRNKPRIEIYKDNSSKWRWRVIAGNGKIVLPPEQHANTYHVRRAILSAIVTATAALVSNNIVIVEGD